MGITDLTACGLVLGVVAVGVVDVGVDTVGVATAGAVGVGDVVDVEQPVRIIAQITRTTRGSDSFFKLPSFIYPFICALL